MCRGHGSNEENISNISEQTTPAIGRKGETMREREGGKKGRRGSEMVIFLFLILFSLPRYDSAYGPLFLKPVSGKNRTQCVSACGNQVCI